MHAHHMACLDFGKSIALDSKTPSWFHRFFEGCVEGLTARLIVAMVVRVVVQSLELSYNVVVVDVVEHA